MCNLTSISTFANRALLSSLVLAFTVMHGCASQRPKTALTPPEALQQPLMVDDRPFAPDTLYSLLVAEMAGDRRRFDVMLGNYVQQAEVTLDPGVAARAARLARYLSVHNTALDMTLLWLDLEPNNAEAHYIATAELVHSNRLQEAVEHATYLLEHGEITGFDAIGARAQQGGDIETTQQLIPQFQQLLKREPKHIPLHHGISLLYQHAGDLPNALKHSQEVLLLDPSDFQAGAQETRILQQMGKTELALMKLGDLVERNPDNPRLRMQYARALLKTDLGAAQQQFEALLLQSPQDHALQLTLALIEHERGNLDNAKKRFEHLLNSTSHQSTAHYYLGRIALVQQQNTAAMAHFRAVRSGSDYLPAMSQLTEMMIANGQTQEAYALVQDQRRDTPKQLPQQVEGLYLLESHLLSSQGQQLKAIALLQTAISQFPDSVQLIFGRAMLFAQLDELTNAEQDFMRILTIRPDHAGALNAWGYTLADRSERLDEAYSFISKAYKLTPDDPAVIDSMGWIEYRLGNIDKALPILRRAMAAFPDHEIAAHFGEVLWVSGNQQEARRVWQEGLAQKPNSSIIKDTMIRLEAVAD